MLHKLGQDERDCLARTPDSPESLLNTYSTSIKVLIWYLKVLTIEKRNKFLFEVGI